LTGARAHLTVTQMIAFGVTGFGRRTMNREEVLSTLQRIAEELLDIDPSKISETTSLGDDLEVDSLDVIDVAMALEKEFRIQFEEEELRSITTAGDVVDLILNKLTQKSGAEA